VGGPGAKGKWQAQVYELLSFRYVRGGFRGMTARFKAGWGDRLSNSRGGGGDCHAVRSAAAVRAPCPLESQRKTPVHGATWGRSLALGPSKK
jgi:hypothetical protein